ncbi:hypothetical protein Syun_023135 [Stephania yunnanensis]|uniref:Uncharacterized protein n=1 Tax=Stephania yunnanensis TaxID=152371 RepID=A0AAP0FMY2_9MAGN
MYTPTRNRDAKNIFSTSLFREDEDRSCGRRLKVGVVESWDELFSSKSEWDERLPPQHRLCGLSLTDCAASPSHHQHHRPNHAFDLAVTPNFVANTLSSTSVYTVRRQQFQVGLRRP